MTNPFKVLCLSLYDYTFGCIPDSLDGSQGFHTPSIMDGALCDSSFFFQYSHLESKCPTHSMVSQDQHAVHLLKDLLLLRNLAELLLSR